MGTGSFSGVKRPGRGADHLPPSSAEVENELSYTSTPTLGPWWPVIGRPLPLPYPFRSPKAGPDLLKKTEVFGNLESKSDPSVLVTVG
jgi:hypothetical protein